MARYIISAVFFAGLAASAYWNDHPIMAAFFAGVASTDWTAAFLSARMDKIDAAIDQSTQRLWDEIAELKNR